MPYQIEKSGVLPTETGQVVEYMVERPGGIGQPVEFDNFTWRGEPPVPVFQEFKGNYSIFFSDWMPPTRLSEVVDKMVEQARLQQSVLPANALHEWYFDTPQMADAARIAFDRAGFDDIAIYVSAK